MPSDMPAAVQSNIDRLKRYQTLETHITRLLGGWLPGIARWEVKQQVAYHLWENMESSRDLRTRLWELRITNPDRGVDPQVIAAVEQLAQAQHDHELIAGIYLVLKPALLEAYQKYVATTFDIYDYPSVMALKPIISRTQEQIAWGKRAVDEMADSGEKRRQVQRWVQYAQDTLAAIGGVNGDGERADLPVPPPAYSLLLPFAEAKRDERFEIVMASPALQDKTDPLAYLVWQFSNYVQEMQAAETLATTLWEVRGMAWEFYYDIARHLWDEVRHSELGENRLKQLGYHITDFPSSIGSYGWRQLFDPVIRYCALTYIIEAGSFKMKHESYQRYLKQGDIESAQAVMYDIMDETMHVRFGQKWVEPLMKHYGFTQPLPDFIEACREIVANHSVAPAQRDAAQAKA
jgi:hypothetical protein